MAAVRLEQIEAGIAELVISQPPRRNAINADMWRQIPKCLAEARAMESLRVLILRGEGDHFSAGADISEFPDLYSTEAGAERSAIDISAAGRAIADCAVPVIAELRGNCYGGAVGLALAADIRLADDTARFAITPAKIGVGYPFEDMVRLAHDVGLQRARDLMFSARTFGADEALAIGLLTPRDENQTLRESVLSYARRLKTMSPASLKLLKGMFSRISKGQQTSDRETFQIFRDSFLSEDFEAGYQAFLNKTTPDFS